jgi:hypothetical protein
MLTAEAYAQEAVAARDSTTLCVKDVEDQTALAVREVVERYQE